MKKGIIALIIVAIFGFILLILAKARSKKTEFRTGDLELQIVKPVNLVDPIKKETEKNISEQEKLLSNEIKTDQTIVHEFDPLTGEKQTLIKRDTKPSKITIETKSGVKRLRPRVIILNDPSPPPPKPTIEDVVSEPHFTTRTSGIQSIGGR